jgi:hypothetical protein
MHKFFRIFSLPYSLSLYIHFSFPLSLSFFRASICLKNEIKEKMYK